MPPPTAKPLPKPPGIAPSVESAQNEELTPLFNVVLLDDDQHTDVYVVEMLGKIFLLPAEVGYRHAIEVDTTGRTVVMTCERAQAEFGRDQIHAYGADPRVPTSKGSMSAIVEPVS